MGRPKKTETTTPPPADPSQIFSNGVCFGIIQLERDLMPKPSAQRIVQRVNLNGTMVEYISENAYFRAECIDIFDKLYRLSYQQSISKGGVALYPVKGRLHWKRFTVDFALGKECPRVNPETDKEEPVELEVN